MGNAASQNITLHDVHLISKSVVVGTCLRNMVKYLVRNHKSKELRSLGGSWFVAFIHAAGVVAMSLQQIRENGPTKEQSCTTLSLSLGYFIQDLIGMDWVNYPVDMVHHFIGIGMISMGYSIQSAAALKVLPLLYLSEASTPFLGIKWLMDCLSMKDTRIYKANLVIFFVSFVVARLVLLPIKTYSVLKDDDGEYKGFGTPGKVALTLANVIQWYWFEKMVRIIRTKVLTPVV